jgi:hypothetical protein
LALKIMSVLALGVGFAGGWAVRSLADSPQGAGGKLLEIGMNTRERVGRWAAVEAERLADMLAEARSRAEPDISRPNGAKNGSGYKGRSGNKTLKPRRRGPRPVKREEESFQTRGHAPRLALREPGAAQAYR